MRSESETQLTFAAPLPVKLPPPYNNSPETGMCLSNADLRPQCFPSAGRDTTHRALPAYFNCSALDNRALAQIIYFCPHAVEPAVAINDQDPLRGQEAKDWIAEAIIIGSGLVRIEAKLRSERS